MDDHRYSVVSTNELPFLIACIETGSYGIATGAMHPREYDKIGDLRSLQLDDRVFIRFKDKILSGPFIITNPHEGYAIDESKGCWHKVNVERTPQELRPVWLYSRPWCFFFDKELASQVNYCPFGILSQRGLNVPPIGFLTPEDGEKLWETLQSFGSSFSDFLQRQGPKIRIYVPTGIQTSYRTSGPVTRNPIMTGHYKTNVGMHVRSKSEKIIADCLDNHGFRFRYEQSMVLDGHVLRPDFYLPDCDLIIEHLGLIETNEEYRKDWLSREALYKKHKRKFITTTESDMKDIDNNLLKRLSQVGCEAQRS